LGRVAGVDLPDILKPFAESIFAAAMPAARMLTTDTASRSYFGGLPLMPADAPRPQGPKRPLELILQIDLGEVHAAVPDLGGLPGQGLLQVFYDFTEFPWGSDPTHSQFWQVRYQPTDVPLVEPSIEEWLDSSYLAFEPFVSFAPVDEVLPNGVSEEVVEAYEEIAWSGDTTHLLLGYPMPIQEDPREDIPRRGATEPQNLAEFRTWGRQFRQLFQFDSDEDLGVMWGDVGRLYGLIRNSDFDEGAFERTWLILQSH